MISVEAARALKASGLKWEPRLHDFFSIPDRDLDGRRFVLSDMSIDIEHIAGYGTLMFNGVVEWSLDYIFRDEVIWLPTEGQLRELLGDRLVVLRREDDRYVIEITDGAGTLSFDEPVAADAYAAALVHKLGEEGG